ncbi:S8 family serine peptidase [Rapidithrix thailandica]|uniref:S8 family serine peptidase n=1 Tax=Rapidithrix thailandica TaxID=413964 RepID=A0AAW9SI68_9BACT
MAAQNFLWRGGEQIPLEKEEEVFTAIVQNKRELENLSQATGVKEVKKVENGIYKVKVQSAVRDTVMQQYREASQTGICHHAYRPKDANNTRYYLTDQLIIRFKHHVSHQRIAQLLSENGLKSLKQYPGMNHTYLVQVTKEAGGNPVKVSNQLHGANEIEYVEPNLVERFASAYLPNDDYFERQWHLKSWEAPELVPEADVKAERAWDITRGKANITIAVMDDGFDLSHPDFAGAGKIVHAKDYVDGDAHPFPEKNEGDYHGTPCAGVALAVENGYGVVGIAPGCAFMPVRFPLSANDDLLWEAFDFVGKRADVISCSWGPVPAYAPLSSLIKDKFSQLAQRGGPRKRGCVIVFAAGNYNAPLRDEQNQTFRWRHPHYGIIEQHGPIVNGYASHPEVVAVAASTSLNKKAMYSNWGEQISVSAPSNNFHPLEPAAYAPGLGIWTTDNERYGEGFSNGRFTGRFGGTSSATPLVAGIAGLILSANPGLSARQVKKILEITADKITDFTQDVILGHNKGEYDENGHSEWFGFGKANAANAVVKAQELSEEDSHTHTVKFSTKVEGKILKDREEEFYKVQIGSQLVVTLEGPNNGADFDLYLKRGAPPTTRDYDFAGFTVSAHEKIIFEDIEPGEYYIMVRSYSGHGEYKIKIALE